MATKTPEQLIDLAQTLRGLLFTDVPDGAAKADAIKAQELVIANLNLLVVADVEAKARAIHLAATGLDYDALEDVEKRTWLAAAAAKQLAVSERAKAVERAEARAAEAEAEVTRLKAEAEAAAKPA